MPSTDAPRAEQNGLGGTVGLDRGIGRTQIAVVIDGSEYSADHEVAAELTSLRAEVERLTGGRLDFRPADEIPFVEPGACKLFIAAVRREGKQAVYTIPAYFLNAFPLYMNDGDGCGECPEDGSHEDGCPQTGWHDCKEKDGWDEYFGVLLTGKDELVAWASIPEFSPALAQGPKP